ncbi:MAG TPA: 2,5-dihydroxypyridine 5,6-dioxygenase [Candidatus Eisenbacteria bacterium]|nr:2,5-dihydroxypyridine 5,6-dioxygenase [Candidatus Eisenbacteria bacterium]
MTVRFPISAEVGGDLVGMALAELRLCKVNKKETVVLFSDTRTNPSYVSAFLAAGKELAGSIFETKVPFLPEAEGKSINLAPVLAVLQRADFVIDLSTGSTLYIYGEGLGTLLAGGTRVLQVKANEDQLRRCFPTEDVRQRTAEGAKWLDRATEIRLISKDGSELTMRKRGRPALTQLGISDQKGRWDSWPSGFLYCAPEEETANGTLVLDVGDLLVMLGRYVSDPVRIEVENGVIRRIEGGVDAVLLRDRLEQAHDQEAYIISHIGWGTDHRARWSEIAQRGTEEGAREVRSTYGNVQIAFGANYRLGGKNKTMAHEDLILRRAKLELDGKTIVDDGRIIPKEIQ